MYNKNPSLQWNWRLTHTSNGNVNKEYILRTFPSHIDNNSSNSASKWLCYGLFPLPETDSDSKPYCYIVLCRKYSTGLDSDSDPYLDGLTNAYCTHFRDRSLSQGQISITILLYFNQGIRVRNWTSGKILHNTGIRVRIWLRQWK